eukprot:TRINITY_DN963_c1_g1_i1.p1 TRINITY_DN963_c1_g1~~TRINITY_DN963_c1_g1_i1.p1  ORF type:complete len:1047 (+),score=449.95 TRINITY_DN963_c1_g1_i1:188-3142(+)
MQDLCDIEEEEREQAFQEAFATSMDLALNTCLVGETLGRIVPATEEEEGRSTFEKEKASDMERIKRQQELARALRLEEEREERRRRREEKRGEGRKKWTYYGYIGNIAREIGFSALFRIWVLVCLYSSGVFFFLLGYHYMMADTFRMVAPPPPDDQPFLVSFAFLAHFFCVLILASTFMHLHTRLVVSWLGTTPESANIFFIPNRYKTERKTMMFRDFQLLVLETALLFVPFLYALIVVLINGESALTFPGHFSFCSFMAMETIVVLIWLYFLWRSLRAKNKAWRMGTRGVKEYQQMRGDSDSDESNSDTDRRRRRRRGDDEDDDTDEDEESPDARRRRKKSRRQKDRVEDGKLRVDWRRRRLANPEVMAEFGADLYSLQAYILHVMIGVVWVLLSLYPTGMDIDGVQWLAIMLVTVVGALLMLRLNISKTKAKRVATRQRLASFVLWIVGGVFGMLSFVAGVSTIPGFGGLLLASLLLTQFFTVRRHDMHVRDDTEAGGILLPFTNKEEKEKRVREKMKNPSVCVPMIPCANVIRACFGGGVCMEPPVIDPEGDVVYYIRESRLSNKTVPIPRLAPPMEMRDGRLDKIIRPAPQPGFKLRETDSSGFVLNAKNKEKLAREEYLNKRERVHQADLVFTTWYLMFFMLVIGLAYGYGDWITSPLAVNSNPDLADPYRGNKNYPVCSFTWGSGDDALTVQDFALLNLMCDGELLDITKGQDAWFSTSNKFLAYNITESQYGRQLKRYRESVNYYVFDGYANEEDKKATPPVVSYRVVVLAQSDFGAAWMRDIDTWGDAVFYQLLSALNPLFSLWHVDDKKMFVKAVGGIKGVMEGTDVLDQVQFAIHAISVLNPEVPIYITGQGTHGGWARILARRFNGLFPVVTFGSPGVVLTGERFDAPDSTVVDDVNVQPRGSVLSMVDIPSGFVQEVSCDSGNSMTKCQRMKNIACDILRSCGDAYGRSFIGFSTNTDVASSLSVYDNKCTF